MNTATDADVEALVAAARAVLAGDERKKAKKTKAVKDLSAALEPFGEPESA